MTAQSSAQPSSPATFETLIYEIPEPHIARIRLNRPDRANAQDTKLLYELNAAFDKAAHDDDVRVAVLYEKPHTTYAPELAWRSTDRWIRFPWIQVPPVRVTAAGRSSV